MQNYTSERITTKQCIELLRKNGWWTMKIHGEPYQRVGIPDVLAIKNGVAWWFEVKRQNMEPTKIQNYIMEQLRAAGCPVHVVHSASELRDIIE